MATSGTIAFSNNAGDTVRTAMKLIGAIDANAVTVTAADMADGLLFLNLMLKGWTKRGPNLWRSEIGTETLAAATATYTLDPNPVRVHSMRHKDSSGNEIPMNQMNAEDYDDLPLKTSTGIPTNFYVDERRDSTEVKVWPVPSAVGGTLVYRYQRMIEDITSQQDDLDVPQEALELVTYCLGARLADVYGDNDVPVQRVIARAQAMLDEYDHFDKDPYIQIEPARC